MPPAAEVPGQLLLALRKPARACGEQGAQGEGGAKTGRAERGNVSGSGSGRACLRSTLARCSAGGAGGDGGSISMQASGPITASNVFAQGGIGPDGGGNGGFNVNVGASGAGTASGIIWYAALTDPGMTTLYGEMDTWTFGWSE